MSMRHTMDLASTNVNVVICFMLKQLKITDSIIRQEQKGANQFIMMRLDRKIWISKWSGKKIQGSLYFWHRGQRTTIMFISGFKDNAAPDTHRLSRWQHRWGVVQQASQWVKNKRNSKCLLWVSCMEPAAGRQACEELLVTCELIVSKNKNCDSQPHFKGESVTSWKTCFNHESPPTYSSKHNSNDTAVLMGHCLMSEVNSQQKITPAPSDDSNAP